MSTAMPSVEGTSPEDRRGRTRASILDAARVLLADGTALAGLSVGDIARAAQVSRPTFYSYFHDKRDLVLALGYELEASVRAAAGPWLEEATGDLRGTLEAVLGAFGTHRSALSAIVEAASYDEVVAAFWRDFHEWFLVNAARRAQHANPGLSGESAEAMAYSLVWMTERSLSEHLLAPRVCERPLLDALDQLWRAGINA